MASQDHQAGEPCTHSVTIERIGDLIVLDIPANDTHYELQLTVATAIRLSSALIRAATNDDNDSLADGMLNRALDAMESEEGQT